MKGLNLFDHINVLGSLLFVIAICMLAHLIGLFFG